MTDAERIADLERTVALGNSLLQSCRDMCAQAMRERDELLEQHITRRRRMPDNPIPFCPGCFATSEDGSAGYTCDETMCYNCGLNGTILISRRAVESIRAQASWVGKRYYPNAEDHTTRAELKLLRSHMPDHETDKWEIEDWAKYTDTPEIPNLRLTLNRRASADSSVSTSIDLPNPYTQEDVEAAKARLRVALPVSWNYGLPEELP